jgi:NitT/TauT family transport system substrate-binding protein
MRHIAGMERRRFLVSAAASAGVSGVLARSARAAGPTTSLGIVQTTHSVQDWPLVVAQGMGFFAQNGLEVDVSIAGASAAVAQQLAAGSAPIGSVSTTQVVEAVLGGAPLTQVLKNVQTSPYTLLGRKGITSVEQLRGKTIMIGGPNDITRVFIDRMLAAHGLHPNEYTYVYAGAPAARYAALLSSAIDAAPLLPPTTFSAIAQGYPALDDSTKYFPKFPTSGYTANTRWATSHADELVSFCKGFLEGVRWLYQPANKARALELLEESTNTKPAEAAQTYEQYMRERLFSIDGRYERSEFAQVVTMLVDTKQIPGPAPDAATFFDDRYVDRAARALGVRR